jgi:membrane-associated protease RseP (regulator of RpoE activity)
MSFWQDYKWVILFYSAIILLVYIFRKKFDMQGKFIAMYRTKIGLKLMDKLGRKHREIFQILGYIGIGVGYVGLFTILYFLLKNLISLFMTPTAQSAVSLVIPGVKIPGSPVMIPLITGWIALFLVIVIHEFSHGVIARAHGLKVKSSGIFFLGPLMGAFVEPEEKDLRKAKDTVQYSVYAAGPFSNVILAMLCILLLTYAFAPINAAMVDETGVELVGITEGYPAAAANMTAGLVVTDIGGTPVTSYPEFASVLSHSRPGDMINITANGTVYPLVAAASPNDPQQGYIGVLSANKSVTKLKKEGILFMILAKIMGWLTELFAVTGILSLGIGLANLLPLGPVDGGRMLLVSLEKIKGKVKGSFWWRNISIATLFILGINLLWPLFKWIGKLFM